MEPVLYLLLLSSVSEVNVSSRIFRNTASVNEKKVIEYAVIGSGPSGWAALDYLVSKGIKPTLIDIGNTEESHLNFETPGTTSSSAVAQKARNGSNHMYTYPSSPDLFHNFEGTVPLTSAFGGLSTVWGTNLQGFEWPGKDLTTAKAFSKSLTEIIKKLPTTGGHDQLDQVYKWPVDFKAETNISQRSDRVLNRFQKNKTWVLGKARNATAGASNGCISCGKCLTGCPVGVIYSTEQDIQNWQKTSAIETVSAQVLRIFQTYESYWEIELLDRNTEEIFTVFAKKVYLGAGSIASAIILMRSNICQETVYLEDTQVVYLPFLSFRDKSAKHTDFSLAQLFLETESGLFDKNSLHISIYEHSETFKERAAKLFPKLAPLIPSFAYRRLMAGIAFLPSELSGRIKVSKSTNQIEVSTVEATDLHRTIATLFRRIFPTFLKIGLIPLRLVSSAGNVGSSYHLGALKSGDGLITNDQGQIAGFPNLYLIDSCSLPLIPAGPITLGIMANSRRITEASI